MGDRNTRKNRLFGGLFVVLSVLLGGGSAWADHVRVGLYQTNDGHVSFILDRSGELPRQQYSGSVEILVLTPVAAARGDTIYRRNDGRLVLRVTPYGALTYFSAEHQAGIPIVHVRRADPLRARMRELPELEAAARILEEHLGLTYGMAVDVHTPNPARGLRPLAVATLCDAVENTKLAIDRLLAPYAGSEALLELNAIEFDEGKKVSVRFRNNTLTISVVPRLRLAGRPSSYQIEGGLLKVLALEAARASKIAAEAAAVSMAPSSDYEW